MCQLFQACRLCFNMIGIRFRVVVRPFKPATEPRDLNPTDKTRANHIVGRVLQLDAAAAAQRLSDVVEKFEGR
ncbi:MAG: hypothetical protein WCE32_06070, partial [Pseudolabrys sp.]